jgi:hypothetical protein
MRRVSPSFLPARVFLALMLTILILVGPSPHPTYALASFAQLSVHVEENIIYGFDFPDSPAVDTHLTIDDLGTSRSPDYIGKVGWVDEGSWSYYILNLGKTFTLSPNQLVTLAVVTSTAGKITKSILIVPLDITGIDRDADTISGVTEPYASVGVDVKMNPAIRRNFNADQEGNWTANFHIFGDEPQEQITYDITGGSYGQAYYIDVDGDTVQIRWDGAYKMFLPEAIRR